MLLDTEDDRVSADVTAQLEGSNPDLVVEDWRWGAGLIADLATNLRTVINAVIGVIAVVMMVSGLRRMCWSDRPVRAVVSARACAVVIVLPSLSYG